MAELHVQRKEIAYHGYGHLSLFLLLEQVCIVFTLQKPEGVSFAGKV